MPPARLHRIANGVDLDRFAPSGGRDGPVVYLGALRPEKNVRRLVRAANVGAVLLDVWGAGPEREALEGLAGPTVRLRGPTARPEDALAGARALALSSDTEQMPLTVLEAMAASLPVVSTDVGDVAAMVSAANRPLIVPLGDEAAYEAALCRVAADEGLAAALGAANRRRAEAEFGFDRMIRTYAGLMDRLASPA